MKDRYEDILHLPHHESPTRPRMGALDRAAQFSSFAALVGFDAALKESVRKTQEPIILTETAQQELDEKLRYLSRLLDQRPEVTVTFFREDPYKPGGEYVCVTGTLMRIDPVYQYLVLDGEMQIDMQKLLTLDSPVLTEEITP